MQLKKCFERLGLHYCFESLVTDLKKLFSRVTLTNCNSIFFCIFICSFPDIHLFLINCCLFRFLNYMFLLVFELLLPVSARLLISLPASTRLLFVSTRFYSFTSRLHYFINEIELYEENRTCSEYIHLNKAKTKIHKKCIFF